MTTRKMKKKEQMKAVAEMHSLPADHPMYERENGELVPMFEADYPLGFTVIRADRRGSVIGDPQKCIEANGIKRCLASVGAIEAYIGSGKEAYVVFKATAARPFVHALHFTIPARSARIRDAFDANKQVNSADLVLNVPTPGRTRAHRNRLEARRREELRTGIGAPKGTNKKGSKSRVQRIGVPHRPKAKLLRGAVTLQRAAPVT